MRPRYCGPSWECASYKPSVLDYREKNDNSPADGRLMIRGLIQAMSSQFVHGSLWGREVTRTEQRQPVNTRRQCSASSTGDRQHVGQKFSRVQ
jgi:hypothetical protein